MTRSTIRAFTCLIVLPAVSLLFGFTDTGPIGAVMGAKYAKDLAGQIKLMEELAKKLADRDYMAAELLERTGAGGKAERLEGMELRALRKLLDEVDRYNLEEFAGYAAFCPTGEVSSTPGEYESYLFARYSLY